MIKLKNFIKFFFIIAFLFSANNVFGATIKGNVFEWYSLQKLNNAIIEINSMPLQRIIAVNGNYEFNVQDGNYLIKAEYFENGKLKYAAEEKIEVKGEGIYNLDLIMFPLLEDINELNEQFDENFFDNSVEESIGKSINNNAMFVIVTLIAFILFAGLIFYFKRKLKAIEKKAEKELKKENQEKTKEVKLDEFALQAIQLLKRYGNRMTQKELREKMNLSEAKISLIVADLESQGLIKKIKKGRGNIIILLEK
jgi:uncharacterized membrane protein